MAGRTDSFHIIYNARHLTPEDVAKTFIASPDYEELIHDNHTVILGARGCGKTTLMKMLTLPAINAWNSPLSSHFKDKLNFYSIYISTDIYWSAQKDAYSKQLSKFPTYAERISKVAVTTNVLFALCETFENITKYKLQVVDDSKEIELAKELIKLWVLPPTIPKLTLIKEALIKRADLLNRHIQKTIFNVKNEGEIKLTEEYFNLDYDTSTLAAINIYERIYGVNNNSKWALCFDELELAPEWLQERLFNSLRSRNQKLLYKLSASPIMSISSGTLATASNDYKLIKMWPHDGNNDYSSFSENLLKSILCRHFSQEVDPEEIFGSNPILRKDKNTYEKDGDTWLQIKELAETDSDLRDLLVKHNIDPKNPVVTKENSRALDTVLRKIKPIVYFRNYYSYFDEKALARKARSRKAHTLFFGKEVLYTISDGNPRWLIGIAREMLKKTGQDRVTKIPEAKQAEVLENIADQFFNVIKTIPEAVIKRKNGYLTLSGILQEIGDYFYNEIIIDKFQRDPHSTFTIDSKIHEEIIKILEKGVYQGALILLDPTENVFDFDMKGKSFRLSYLFCPKFKIPIRKYSNLNLSKCLTEKEIIPTNSQTQINF